MKLNITKLTPAIVCVAIFATLIILVWDYVPHAKRLLLIMGWLGLLLSVILLVRELIPKGVEDRSGGEKRAMGGRYAMPGKKVLTSSAWIAGILPVIYLVGFTIGISLYVFIYYKLHRGRWLSAIVLGVIMAAVVYFGFVVGMEVRFPRPILLPFFRG